MQSNIRSLLYNVIIGADLSEILGGGGLRPVRPPSDIYDSIYIYILNIKL